MAKVRKKQNRPGATAARKGVKLSRRQYTQNQLYSALISVGMIPSRAKVGSAIAMAESHGISDAVGDGGTSFSPWQVHLPAHPQYSRKKLQSSLLYAAKAAKEISNNGKDWTPWTTYQTGAYRQYMGTNLRAGKVPKGGAAGAANQKMGAPTGGTATASSGPGQAVLTSFDPFAPLGPLDPLNPGNINPVPFGPHGFPGLDIPGLGDIPGVPEVSDSIYQILPQQIQDFFSLLNNLFTLDFWLKVGKVLLGIAAIYVGANALLKISTGVDATGSAKKAVGTATAIAATAAKVPK